MRVLCTGDAFCQTGPRGRFYHGGTPHAVRYAALAGEADYHFAPGEAMPAFLARIAPHFQPDVLLCWLPSLHPPPHGIEEVACRTAALISDWNLQAPALIDTLRRFDRVYCDLPGSTRLRLPGVRPRHVTPLYAHQPARHRELGIARDYDAVFVGNLNPAIHARRAALLQRLAAWGAGRPVHIGGGVFGAAYTRLLNRAQLVVNHSVRGELNLRCFEAWACGAPLLLERDNDEAQRYLAPDEEVVLYDTGDFEARLESVLADAAWRARLQAGGRTALARLAPATRLATLLDDLVACETGAARSYHTLDAEVRAAAEIGAALRGIHAPQQAAALHRAEALAEKHAGSPEVLAGAAALAVRALRAGAARDTAHTYARALAWQRQAVALAPEAPALWLNLAIFCSGHEATAAQCVDRAQGGNDLTGARWLLGAFDDAAYVSWMHALATDTCAVGALHAMAAARAEAPA